MILCYLPELPPQRRQELASATSTTPGSPHIQMVEYQRTNSYIRTGTYDYI
jgi:hypothetical protein